MKRFLGYFALLGCLSLGFSGRAAANLIVNGDFESGNSGFTSGYVYVAPPNLIDSEGQYAIGTDPSKASIYGDWAQFGDHTSGRGNMLIANASTVAGASVWSQTVSVQANTTYVFSFWGASVNQSSGSLPVLQARIDSSDVGSSLTLTTQGGVWLQGTGTWFSGSNTTVTLSIVDLNIAGGWNDFALDDLQFNAVAAVPEPSSVVALLAGVLGVSGAVYRSRKIRAGAQERHARA